MREFQVNKVNYLTYKEPRVVCTYIADQIPRIPRTIELRILHWLFPLRFRASKRKEVASGSFTTVLSIHWHVDRKRDIGTNVQGLLNRACILHKPITGKRSVLKASRTGNKDIGNATERSIRNLDVEDLSRDTRNDRVGRAEVDPCA